MSASFAEDIPEPQSFVTCSCDYRLTVWWHRLKRKTMHEIKGASKRCIYRTFPALTLVSTLLKRSSAYRRVYVWALCQILLEINKACVDAFTILETVLIEKVVKNNECIWTFPAWNLGDFCIIMHYVYVSWIYLSPGKTLVVAILELRQKIVYARFKCNFP